MAERRILNNEIDSWVNNLETAFNYARQQIMKKHESENTIENCADIILENVKQNLLDYARRNPSKPVFEFRYSDKYYTLRHCYYDEEPVIPSVNESFNKALAEIEVIRKEYNSMLDIIHSHPTKEDLDVVAAWCNKCKPEMIQCGQN